MRFPPKSLFTLALAIGALGVSACGTHGHRGHGYGYYKSYDRYEYGRDYYGKRVDCRRDRYDRRCDRKYRDRRWR
jgi:hypothetical protein